MILLENSRIALLLALVAAGAMLRVLPHPANFCPIISILGCLFTHFPIYLALGAAILLLVGSDILLYYFFSLPASFAAYLAYLIIFIISTKKKPTNLDFNWQQALILPFIYWLASNFFIWAGTSYYPFNEEGFIRCFCAALPFLPPLIIANFITSLLLEKMLIPLALANKKPLAIRVCGHLPSRSEN